MNIEKKKRLAKSYPAEKDAKSRDQPIRCQVFAY